MINRKKKLLLTQIFLFLSGMLVLFFTYYDKDSNKNLTTTGNNQIEDKSKKSEAANKDVFYNIEYTGIDLSGNRYIIKSKEALNNQSNLDVVDMKNVEAIFYFKDNSSLKIFSRKAIYNNKTLDVKFEENVRATHKDSKLFAENAEFSNSKEYLIISDKVKIIDTRGTIKADKLQFDLKNQTLDITSFDQNKISANIGIE
tara:strand:+ start:47 stop:646 length:600 start_codon:yes stop_codon:yes gene_type:complete